MRSLRLNLLVTLFASAFFSGCASTAVQEQAALGKLCSAEKFDKLTQRELLAGGFQAIQSKQLVCAENLTERARKLDPKDPYAALNLGAIYQRTGRIELAKKEYEQAIVLDGGAANASDSNAVIATLDQAKNQRPSDIAKRNLVLLNK